MPRSARLLLVAILLAGLLSPAVVRTDELASHPAWATKMNRPGLPNLHKVSHGLYRGAQPTAEGIKELEKMGVKTIVCLRTGSVDEKLVKGSHMALEEIPMNAWDVKEEHVVRFLKIAADKKRQPVFVHCQHGADRTGAMCAAYRVVIDGWTKQHAIDEMTKGDFNFHSVWINLPKFIENLNVEAVKAKARIEY